MNILTREGLRVGVIATVLPKEMMFCAALFYIAKILHLVDGNVLYRPQHAILFPFSGIFLKKTKEET